jgi:hypothetical protein
VSRVTLPAAIASTAATIHGIIFTLASSPSVSSSFIFSTTRQKQTANSEQQPTQRWEQHLVPGLNKDITL